MQENEVEYSWGNVFEDLQLPNADELKRKSDLIVDILRAIRKLDLSEKDAAIHIEITEDDLHKMMGGSFDEFSETQLTYDLGLLKKFGASHELS